MQLGLLEKAKSLGQAGYLYVQPVMCSLRDKTSNIASRAWEKIEGNFNHKFPRTGKVMGMVSSITVNTMKSLLKAISWVFRQVFYMFNQAFFPSEEEKANRRRDYAAEAQVARRALVINHQTTLHHAKMTADDVAERKLADTVMGMAD
jgi:hypothetical protein